MLLFFRKVRNMKKLVIAVVAVTSLAFLAFAKTLEVGATRAYRTIQFAADVAQPGDAVLIDPGVYREWAKVANVGTETVSIVYRTREKGKTVITGADVADFETDPNDGRTEIVVRPSILYPIRRGRDYLRLEGLARPAGGSATKASSMTENEFVHPNKKEKQDETDAYAY